MKHTDFDVGAVARDYASVGIRAYVLAYGEARRLKAGAEFHHFHPVDIDLDEIASAAMHETLHRYTDHVLCQEAG